MKTTIIKDVFGRVLYESRYPDLKHAVLSAVTQGISLAFADLENADLSYLKLHRGFFKSANLRGANLQGADLMLCNFTEASLENADLSGAYLMFTSFGKTNLINTKIDEYPKLKIAGG